MTLQEYIKEEGRGSITNLAKQIGIKPSIVSFWVGRKRQVPIKRCPEIERITKGKVACEELRPDVNWGVLRNSKKGK